MTLLWFGIPIVISLTMLCAFIAYESKFSWRWFWTLALFLGLAASASAQGSYFSSNAWTASRSVTPGQSAPVLTLPFSRVFVCASPASPAAGAPCTNVVPIFSDSAMSIPIAQPLTADAQGQFGFYASPGQYSFSLIGTSGKLYGTYPMTLGGIGSTFNILYADMFPGADIAEKIANAFASVAGTAAKPTASALVLCSPGQNYTVTSGPVSIPRGDAPPYITAPTIDCQNSHITDGRANNSSPLIDIGPNNALSSGAGGKLMNVFLTKDNTTGPAIQMTDRLGFTLSHIFISGGLDAIKMTSVAATDGAGNPIPYPYLEQNRLEDIGIVGCGRYGINEETLAGGSGSHLYNHYQVKYDLGGGCRTAVYNGPGSDSSGSIWFLDANTGGDPSYHFITNDGSMYSGDVYITGEATGNGGATIALMDGGAYAHPNLYNGFRGGVIGISGSAQPTLPLGCTTQESFFLGRNGMVCLSSNLDVLMAANGGQENDSHAQFRSCPTFGSGSRVDASTTCKNVFIAQSIGGALFGSGYSDNQTPAMLPAGPVDIGAHSMSLVPNTPRSTNVVHENTWFDRGNGSLGHVIQGYDEIEYHTDLSGNVTSGTKYTGACTYSAGAPVTFHIVNGAIVSCN